MADGEKKIHLALAGNPKSGKTAIYNNLTGARQHLGDFSGVTVGKKVGKCRSGSLAIEVVDLPGIYSLTAYSLEELVARNYLIEEKPDVVVDILDGSNLERNLYLTTQLMELGVPLVLALNMSDLAANRGIEFDLQKLSELLGLPIVATVGHKGQGINELLAAVEEVCCRPEERRKVTIRYGQDLEAEIAKLQELIEKDPQLTGRYGSRWLAIKLMENDKEVLEKVRSPEILSLARSSAERIEKLLGDPAEIILADRRYGFISGACQESMRLTVETRHTMSDKIDEVATNSVLGLPILFGLMYVVFYLTFKAGEPPMRAIEHIFGWLAVSVNSFWPAGSLNGIKSLLADGIINGVGGVVVFLPNILILFAAISILEDSGYMARAAFVMDRLMHKIGLHGKSFIPLLIGFGCSVPAIMATRTLENRRDRLATMLIIPLMSCAGRFPIYALFIPAFFPPKWNAPALWIIYVIGVLLAILSARLLRKTLLKGPSSPFVMELPPYRMPTLKGTLVHMWERGWLYLRKAGTIILGFSILLWALTSYPKISGPDSEYQAAKSRAEAQYLEEAEGLSQRSGLGLTPEELVRVMEQPLPEAQAARMGRPLAVFNEIYRKVLTAQHEFDQALAYGRISDGTPAYLALELKRDRALAEAGSIDPVVFAEVSEFVEKVKRPFDSQISGLERIRQAKELSHSIAGRIGHALDPVLRPLGFDWKVATALLGAFAAKEIFVVQMAIVTAVDTSGQSEVTLRQRLRTSYPPLAAFCIILFCLIATPCVATLAVTMQESGSWRWALLQWGGLTALAYVITLLVYQTGSLLGLGI